jgi:signal transduction histidine kinase
MQGALALAMQPQTMEEDRFDALDAAQSEVGRTLATLSAMLDIARAESGLSREMMLPVDLRALLVDVTEVFAPMIEDAGQTLTVDLPADPVVIRAHEALLRQAVGNLLHNASIYAGSGARVRVSVEDDDGFVRLIVADTGPGVPPEQAGRVQERFVRLDPARSTGGSGLGLAIVAACAKLHEGVLKLEDNGPGLRAVLDLARFDAALSSTGLS